MEKLRFWELTGLLDVLELSASTFCVKGDYFLAIADWGFCKITKKVIAREVKWLKSMFIFIYHYSANTK
jgi:hypothetical protein